MRTRVFRGVKRGGVLAMALCAIAFVLNVRPVSVKAASDAVQSEEAVTSQATSAKAIAAGIAIGLAAAAGAIGMALAISKSADGISRQPEAAGDIRSSLTLGLVFIETAIIYALIVAILIIFVL